MLVECASALVTWRVESTASEDLEDTRSSEDKMVTSCQCFLQSTCSTIIFNMANRLLPGQHFVASVAGKENLSIPIVTWPPLIYPPPPALVKVLLGRVSPPKFTVDLALRRDNTYVVMVEDKGTRV
ncbi:hypothetical protein M404DRAFT_435189 [Pisolithus tinctorius Marx 270]|uniref:Uncharacterized protein n=1 Tax=Pisolithus tinctorius Marx 270 TaxID=870435 RepID=A0A0C3P0F4_PISTI|nr:hypothetical protein M404DRAFT_435189 [Pisolithus tinctorius Marx 270]